VKQRYVRVGDEIADNVSVVVRGGFLDADVLRTDSLRNFAVYGTYGVSVFASRDITLDEMAQAPPMVRFGQLTLMTVEALRREGLRLEPTGRNPRHFDVAFDDLEQGVERLLGCEHRTIVNPYHE
jgi:hypothetical protein